MTDARRPYHHPDLRSALLAAAMDVVNREGHGKLSLRALAAKLEVSPTAPQAHFANRQALLAALAAQGFQDFRRRLDACDLDGEPIVVFTALADAYLGFATERPGVFRLMFGADVNLDGDDALATAGNAAFDVLRRAVAKHGRPAQSEEETESTALMAWSTVHGLAHILLDRSASRRVNATLDAATQARAAARHIVRTFADNRDG